MSFVVSKMSESKLHLRLRQIKRNCAICGAEGAAQRNGVYSCVGCAEFYEKTIKKHKRYSCRFQDNCLIRNNLPSNKICKCCRYKKCCSAGMAAPPIPSSNHPPSLPSSLPSTSSPEIVFISTSPSTNIRARKDHVSRILILENCVFVSCLCPAFVLPYLRNDDSPQLLNVAAANFAALLKSSNYYPVTERFYSLFLETASRGPPNENENERLITHKIRILMEQYIFASAEIIKTQIKSEVEFAALSQMTVIKIAGEQSLTTETELTHFVNRVSSEYRNFCRETGEIFNDTKFWNLITATNKIHQYRQSTKKQIQQLLKI